MEIRKEPFEMDYEFGSVALSLEIDGWQELLDEIDDKDLYPGEMYEKETEPHVTIIFGIHSNEVDDQKVIDLIKTIDFNHTFTLDQMGLFQNEWDVLHFRFQSDYLKELNEKFRKFPCTIKFPEYKAHTTVAYLKSGLGIKYLKPILTPLTAHSTGGYYTTNTGFKYFFNP